MALPLFWDRKSGSKIAFFDFNAQVAFVSEMIEYMTSSLPENISFVVRDAGDSQAVQNRQIVELIEEGSDLFIISAVDRLACRTIVEKSSKYGIPIIFFNREPLEDAFNISNNVFYVGTEADSLGIKQAEMVAELFTDDFMGSRFDKNNDGVVQLIILKGRHGHQDAEKRTENSLKRLIELGYTVDLLTTYAANWRRTDAYEAMRLLYAQYGDGIELIFANNDNMALGAIDYLTDAGVFSPGNDLYDNPIVIVGVDGSADGLKAVEEGLMYGTVHNDNKKQSDAVLALMEYILGGHDLESFPYQITDERFIFIDGDIITRNNLLEFKAASETFRQSEFQR